MSSSSEIVFRYASSSSAPPLRSSRYCSSRCCASSSASSDSAEAVRANGARRDRTRRFQSAMLHSCDPADQGDEVLPALLLGPKRPPAFRGEVVVPTPPLLSFLH